jgi:hypothetical protein
MQFFRNRAVPSGVLRSKREKHNKIERHEAASEKRKVRCIPTSKIREINIDIDFVAAVTAAIIVVAAPACTIASLLLLFLYFC